MATMFFFFFVFFFVFWFLFFFCCLLLHTIMVFVTYELHVVALFPVEIMHILR